MFGIFFGAVYGLFLGLFLLFYDEGKNKKNEK